MGARPSDARRSVLEGFALAEVCWGVRPGSLLSHWRRPPPLLALAACCCVGKNTANQPRGRAPWRKERIPAIGVTAHSTPLQLRVIASVRPQNKLWYFQGPLRPEGPWARARDLY